MRHLALINSPEAALLLLEGLRELEHYGYDTAGIPTVDAAGQLSCLKAEGKLVNHNSRY